MRLILLILSFVCVVHVVFGQAETDFQFSKKFVPIKEQFSDLKKTEYKRLFRYYGVNLKNYDWSNISMNKDINTLLIYDRKMTSAITLTLFSLFCGLAIHEDFVPFVGAVSPELLTTFRVLFLGAGIKFSLNALKFKKKGKKRAKIIHAYLLNNG